MFKREFNRFHSLLLQQIGACTSEEVWLSKTGIIAIHALIGQIRHYNYHPGCPDSILRAHGIPGVY